MAKLPTNKRDKLSKKQFAGPGRSYPVNDAEHARKAIQLSARAVKAGTLSAAEREKIVARANRVLGRHGK